MTRTVISTAAAPAAIGPYNQAIVANGFVFTAGQIALVPGEQRIVDGDVKAQTERVLENLKAVLEAAGSSLDRVVKTTVFLIDMADFPAVNGVYARYFPEESPARSTVAVRTLPLDVRVEIEAVALTG
ncbi:MAG: endoribonuclease L-PSP [Gemmatimonadota bacterium]|nr:MAG: endoribonuclease L-PSP [Gemmatimonadota bacterium]